MGDVIAAKRWTAVTLLAATLGLGGPAHRKTEAGNRAYEAGDLDAALRAYTDAQTDAPEAAELFYDIGNVLFRQGDYEGAADSFRRALLSSPSRELEAAAAYNLGNARFRQQELQDAVEAYERALRAAPGDRDTQRNLELALRALERRQRQDSPGDERRSEPGEEEPDGGDEADEGAEEQDAGRPSEGEDSGESGDEERESDPTSDEGEEGEGATSAEGDPSDSEGESKDGRGPSESADDPSDPGGADGEGTPGENDGRGAPGRRAAEGAMSEDEAQRLLDSVAALEQENLEAHRAAQARSRGKTREKDW